MLYTSPEATARLRNQHPDIMPGSPAALVAIFTEIVRERFRPNNLLPWVWDGISTPDESSAGTTASPRRILIEPAFSETAEVRNYRPAIYIDRGPVMAGKVAVGNFAGQQTSTGLRAFYAMAQVPITVQVESSRKGESAILADTVWFYLLGGIEPIRASFDIQDMSTPQLGQTVPSEKDKVGWVTPVSFAITTNLRWTTLPISSVLRSTTATVNNREVVNYGTGG